MFYFIPQLQQGDLHDMWMFTNEDDIDRYDP